MKLQNQIRALMLNTSHPFFQFNDIAYPIGDSLALLFIALPFLNGPTAASFSFIFVFSKKQYNFYKKSM